MSKVKVAAFSISLDGFGAGPGQGLNNALGVRGLELHTWFQNTETFRRMTGGSGGSKGIDNDFAAQSFADVGAWIIGRNMFGPIRGPWEDNSWKGWWGDNPPFRAPVFVLTHHARPALAMQAGTTFHFVTDGPEAALERAKETAGSKDVRIGGGVSVLRQYLALNLIDDMHLALSSVFLGEGEHLFDGLNLSKLGYATLRVVPGEGTLHLVIGKI